MNIAYQTLHCIFIIAGTRRVFHVEQELLALPEHMGSPPVFSGVHVARFLVLGVMFCGSFFTRLPFFIWPLHSLSYIQLLVTTLVYSNFSSFVLLFVLLYLTLRINLVEHNSSIFLVIYKTH